MRNRRKKLILDKKFQLGTALKIISAANITFLSIITVLIIYTIHNNIFSQPCWLDIRITSFSHDTTEFCWIGSRRGRDSCVFKKVAYPSHSLPGD